jgi:probable F420-dependent oxidoreductase
MKAGWGIPNNWGGDNPNELIDIAVKAEDAGFASVWVREHLFHASYVADRLHDRPYYDALTVLIAIGQATETIRLGTSVLVLPWHDPPRLGKMIATLDQLSGGRVDMGIGVAMTEDEFENLGINFKNRGKRTDDFLGALQALWTQDIPDYVGDFYRYSGQRFSPKPKQQPYPPILIGGYSKAAFRRIARFGDGWHTLRQSPKQVAAGVAEIVRMTEEEGRDASSLRHSITLPLDYSGNKDPDPSVNDRTILRGGDDDMAETINSYRDAGLDEIIVSVNTADLTENTETIARFMNGAWAKI